MVCDSRCLALMLATLTSIAGLGTGVGHVLEGDGAFYILPREYGLVLPFHKDLNVRRHGGVSACGQSTRA